jgi:hypothetical protein
LNFLLFNPENLNEMMNNTFILKNTSKKVFFSFLILFGFTNRITVNGQHPSIGNFSVYYGTLQNDSNVSDGTGTADYAYNYAKNNGGHDFFGLSDQAYLISASEWTTIKNFAESYNQDGVSTTFWGFEWSHNTHGHVTIIDTDDYWTRTSVPTFTQHLPWLEARDCAAFFNHPGRQDDTGQEFGHFTDAHCDKVVGIKLWNKADDFPSQSNLGFSLLNQQYVQSNFLGCSGTVLKVF